MAINVNNTSSLPPVNSTGINQAFRQISSGERINSAADDPAGKAITTRFDTRVDGLTTSIRNAGDGISLIQLGSGALEQITDNLARIRELSLQSANGTLSDTDRQGLQQEAGNLLESSVNILKDTQFNGVNLFAQDSSLDLQIGPDAGDTVNVAGRNLLEELNDLGLNNIDISSQQGATEALEIVDQSQQTISTRAGEFGAVSNRFESAIETFQTARVNTAAARSRIADTDIAQAATTLVSEQIRNEAQIAVRAQANAQSRQVLNLLSGI